MPDNSDKPQITVKEIGRVRDPLAYLTPAQPVVLEKVDGTLEQPQSQTDAWNNRWQRVGGLNGSVIRKSTDGVAMNGEVHSNALTYEDEFSAFYTDPTLISAGVSIIMPPYNMQTLEVTALHNNALLPCIDAMVANIDGTGHTVKLKGGTDPLPAEEGDIQSINDFFDEVYPGMSFMTLRDLIRRDLENTGNCFMEVLRTVNGKIAFLRHVEAKTVRIVRLDRAVRVKKTVTRNGKEVSIIMNVRERRFCQKVNLKLMYFKELGASRNVDKFTGMWETEESPIPLQNRGTELIHLINIKDPSTPYGVPKWATQMPSVLGSRKAEEYNLTFFESGGLPPALIIVSGGAVAEEARQYLENLFSGSGTVRHRAAVVEAYSTNGSLEQANNVKVQVERFGHERQADSLFENYDQRCEMRIRGAFRLPALLVGSVEQYTYASAYASYSVAEAQVFSIERRKFDEMVNKVILPLLDGGEQYVFTSKPITIKDAPLMMQGIMLAVTSRLVNGDDVVTAINELTGLDLKYTQISTLPLISQQPGAAKPSDTVPNVASADGGHIVDNAFVNSSRGGGDSSQGNGTPNESPRGSEKADIGPVSSVTLVGGDIHNHSRVTRVIERHAEPAKE